MKYFLKLVFIIFANVVTVVTVVAQTTPDTSATPSSASSNSASNPSKATVTKKTNDNLNNTILNASASKNQTKINKQRKSKKKKPVPPPTPLEPAEPPKEDIAEILYPEEIAVKVSSAVVGLANRIDSFFGTERSDDEKNGSTLRVVPTYTYYEHQKSITELGVNLNLKLRNLESKAKKLEKAIRDEFVPESDPNKAKSNSLKKSEPPPSEEDWHYNIESKLASRPAIYYSGKFRARKNFTGEILLHHFAFSFGWDTDDQWSQITSFSSDRALSDFLLFRFSNDANWYLSDKLMQTTHGPSLIHNIDKYNSMSYNFRLTFGNEKNKIQHFSTVYSINYRHGTPSQRIFIDLIPTFAYPKSDYFTEVKSLEIRFEYFFGDL